jgi:pteridine reductase
MELAGRVALVKGAGRRLGRAFAEALAARGMTMALHYNSSASGADELRNQVVAAGGRAECFQADLADPASARGLSARVAEQFGQLDVLVNSAAVMQKVSFEDTTPDIYDEVMNLNLRSVFFVSQGAAPFLRKTRGKIVNMADLSGLEPWPGYVTHSISKAGVVMLTKVLARSLAPEVTVNAIAPGAVLVPADYDAAERARLADSTPLGRLGTADDAVQALLYLLERADFVTGDVIVVDGGRLLR